MKSRQHLKRQSGFLLSQLGVALTIFGMISAYVISVEISKNSDAVWQLKSELVGETAKIVDDSAKTYGTKYFTYIQRNLPITGPSGYVIPAVRVQSPTLDDLVAVANLRPQAVNPIVYLNQNIGFNVRFTVDTSGGCVIPTCNLISTVSSTAPIVNPKDTSQVDVRLASIAAGIASPANGGVALPDTPAVFTGQNGITIAANPAGIAGTIAIRGGYDSSGFMEFDRRDGSLPRTGDINMQDTTGMKHNINAAGRVTADEVRAGQVTLNTLNATQINSGNISNSGQINTSSLVSTNGNFSNLSTTNLSTTNTWTTNTWATNTSSTNVWADSISSSGRVNANGRIVTGEYLDVNGWATEGAWCEKEGLIGRTNGGSIISCQSGSWKKIASSGGIKDMCMVYLSSYENTVADDICNAGCGRTTPGRWLQVGSWDADHGHGIARRSLTHDEGFNSLAGGYMVGLCAKVD